MNWNRGLRRISAAFWGLFAALVVGFGGYLTATVQEQQSSTFFIVLGLLLLAAIGHRMTTWIIDGFLPA